MATVTVSRPFFDYDNDDHAAVVMTVTVICSALTLGTLTIKALVHHGTHKATWLVDTILYLGAAFMFVQSICIISATTLGLGKHVSDDKSHELEVLKVGGPPSNQPSSQAYGFADIKSRMPKQSEYAASIFAIVSLACTKASVCLLIKQINSYGRVCIGAKVLLGVVVVSSGTGLLGATFRCSMPAPWRAASETICPSAKVIYLYNGIMDVVTDLLLCVLAIAMVWDVRTDTKKRATVIALFTCRIVLV